MVKSLIQSIKDHLSENKMTYLQHLRFAGSYGFKCITAGFYLLIHSIFPCWFAHVGSRLVRKMEKDFTERENESKSTTQS